MADRLESFTCTVPAGTAAAAPARIATPFPEGHVTEIDVIIPAGVAGLAGFSFWYDTQQVIPNTPGGWIIGNDEKVTATPNLQSVGDRWSLVGYNTDVNDHTFYVRYQVDDVITTTPETRLLATAIPAPPLVSFAPADEAVPAEPTGGSGLLPPVTADAPLRFGPVDETGPGAAPTEQAPPV